MSITSFYCVKCKHKVESAIAEIVQTKNGRYMAKSKCPICGTNINKFVPMQVGEGFIGDMFGFTDKLNARFPKWSKIPVLGKLI